MSPVRVASLRTTTALSLVPTLAGALVPGAASAQDYPSRPVRMVAGFAPGGITDVLARAVAARMSEGLGQTVNVENRPGAGTLIACELVARAPADGYTLLFQDVTTHSINASFYRKLPYDSEKDFTAVGLVAASPLMLAVHPSVPGRSLAELIALAKAKPGALTLGTGGVGTTAHVGAAMINRAAGTRIQLIGYKGSAPTVTAVLSGDIELTLSTTPALLSQVKSGRMRALGLSSKSRVPGLDVPTIAEGGLPGFEIMIYSGVLGPAGLPPAVLNRLSAELVRAVDAQQVRATLAELGAQPAAGTPAQFATHLRTEIVRLGEVVRASGAQAQ
ncbi:MAG: Bug family tripartite tricarboxylate transporter substrate binding protein [bacterium]|jgi:tripartite-type tricarboxylate transporter receptor subunit TctC|nr:tripartite tricarboxylate transporter substrate binding protein [Betaproteobacteria bacterium]